MMMSFDEGLEFGEGGVSSRCIAHDSPFAAEIRRVRTAINLDS